MSTGVKDQPLEPRRGEVRRAGDEPQRRPGRPKLDNAKQPVSLRLEPEVLAKFKATGPGWQRRMNDVLKAAVIEASKQ